MAEYSNSIKIHEIEPVYFSANNRVEFRLPHGKLYTNNMIVANVGTTKSAGASVYCKLPGAYGHLRSVGLFDGNTELQVLTRANEWAAIKNSLHSNAYNEDVGSMLSLSRKSTVFNIRDTTGLQANGIAFGAKVTEGSSRALQAATGTTDRLSGKAQLDLAEVLNLLQSIPYVDTEVFKDLKVVLEYDSTITNIFKDTQNQGVATTIRPFLIAEEIVEPDIIQANLGKVPRAIQYKVIENDIVTVPLIATTAQIPNPVQSNTFHIHAFNNKSVDRMLIKTRTQLAATRQEGNSDVSYGEYNSQAMLLQKNQVRVNGKNIFARDGITKENERLALFSDTWGSNHHQQPFAYGLAPKAVDANTRDAHINLGNEVIGSQSYFGCDLAGVKVKDLQLDYERVGFRSSVGGQIALCKYNSALDLIIFAEVKKAIIPSGKGYNVVYV